MSVRIRIENCSPGEVIDLTLALSAQGRGSLVAEVDPARPSVAIARTRGELAGLLRPSEQTPPARREDGSLGAEAWGRLLPWAAAEAGAAGAFVLDQAGLVVAGGHDLPFGRLDELSAHLCVLVHEAVALRALGLEVGSTSIEIGAWRLTVLQIPIVEGAWLALVLVGDGAPARGAQQAIIDEVRHFITSP
jgi:hypothetical protein